MEQEVLKKCGTASPEREKNGTKRPQAETMRVVLSWQQLSTQGLPAPAGSPHSGQPGHACPGHGPGLPRNQPRPLSCQELPQCRWKRLKAKIQLESETLILHSSHPSKCPVAALRNCCSKVYFQHRNKQCDSIPQKWDPCNTNRKLSTVVL